MTDEILAFTEGKVDRAQREQRIQRALRRLPLAQQTLLECHYWHELDAAALAEIFGVPAGTIRVRLVRARNALRDAMDALDRAGGPESRAAADPLTISLRQLRVADRDVETSDS